jgi:hypothetical protein
MFVFEEHAARKSVEAAIKTVKMRLNVNIDSSRLAVVESNKVVP